MALFQSARILQRAVFGHEHLPARAGAEHGALPGDHDWQAAWLYYLTAVRLCAGWAAWSIGMAGLRGAACGSESSGQCYSPLLPPCSTSGACTREGRRFSFRHCGLFPTTTPVTHSPRCHSSLLLVDVWFLGQQALATVDGRLDSDCGFDAVADPATTQRLGDLERVPNQFHYTSRLGEAAAGALASEYHAGAGVFTSFGDLTGILRAAGIPLHEALYDGDEPEWMRCLNAPGSVPA